MASGPEAGRPGTSAGDAVLAEARAYRLFETARWPDGSARCPHCGADGCCRLLVPTDGVGRATRTGRTSARRVWRCGRCRRQFSVLTGTVLERTKVPLQTWLRAVRILSAPGPSAASCADLARAVGVSGDTAATMLYLVRAGLSAAGDTGPTGQFQG